MSVQFSKLSDGSWGVRVYGRCPTIGERLTVVRKDGSSTVAIVASIVSRTPQHTTCAIESKRGKRGAAASSSRWQGKRAGGVTFAVAPDRVPLEIDWDAEADAEERAAITRENGGRPINRMAPEPASLSLDAPPFGWDRVGGGGSLHEDQVERLERDTDPAPFLWAAFDDHADDWSR